MTSGRKKTILHFIDSGGVYGAENVILNLSKEMKSDGVYEPVVGCIVPDASQPNDLYEAALACGLRAEKIVIRNRALLWDLPRAARRLKDLEVDLVHSHGYKPSVFGQLMKPLSRIPVMATCHLWFKDPNRPLKMRLMIFLELNFYRRFPVVVGVSEAIRTVLVESGVDAGRTIVIRNGVEVIDLADKASRRNDTRRALGISNDDFLVINTGRLTAQKSQKTIVEAATRLVNNGLPLRVFIVGEGELASDLEREIRAAGVENSVTLTGFRRDITDLLLASDLFVLPSLDEGMPMSLIEAASAALPVIVTPVGDIPKLINQGESGLIVPPQDPQALSEAIRTVHNDRVFAGQLGTGARDSMKRNFSREAMAKNYLSVYRDLLGD